jgi:hypothetical protein
MEWIIKTAAACTSFAVHMFVFTLMGDDEDMSIRRLIRLLEETFFGQPQLIGLKELFLFRDLDALVLSIATSDYTSEGGNLERHKMFLRDQTHFSKQYLIKLKMSISLLRPYMIQLCMYKEDIS